MTVQFLESSQKRKTMMIFRKISTGSITTGTVPVSSSIQPTNNPPTDGATIIVVAVVIILVVIVVGVVILVVLFRAKKRKQWLVINKLQTITMQNANIEVKLKQEGTTKKAASSSADQSPYEVSNLLYQSIDQLDPPSAKNVNLKELESNPMYQSMDQHRDPPSTTNVSQETDIYTMPDTTSSHTLKTQGGIYEAVYSEPIQTSLFTDAVGSLSDCEDLQPYAPIYTIPTALPKSEVLLKVSGSNIQELGMGIFGKQRQLVECQRSEVE